MKLRKFLFILWAGILFVMAGCEDENLAPADVRAINHFIKDNMSSAYLWNLEMPNLNPNKHFDSEKYFNELLFDEIDHWSFITNDYNGLQKYFSGIRKSMGHSFRLFRKETNPDELIGFIEYVYPDSPAERAGLKRGDMFNIINGQELTVTNYIELLDRDQYTVTFGIFNSDDSITPLSPSVELVAEELSTNPILVHKVLEHAGHKIGYLAYTSFIDDYNSQLESVFAEFKAANIESLVLDLRYNGGGAISTAILMSSMIAPSSEINEVFIRTAYNDNLNSYFNRENNNDPEFFIDRLQTNTNNLNLEKIVALTTYKTASASEMVMYGLSPHMEVYHIGEQTHGKYYGSITISDPEEKHNWAIQPIVMRAENEDNSINYTHGLVPNEEVTDFLQANSIYELGDVKEDFLARALRYLTGVTPDGAYLKTARISPLSPINKDLEIEHPLKYDMQLSWK